MNTQLWYGLKDNVVRAIQHPGVIFSYNNISTAVKKDRNKNLWLTIEILTGRKLYYFKPFLEQDDFGLGIRHWGINSYTKKWEMLRLIPGRITENIVQAIARDVLINGQDNLKKAGYKIIGSVHDEFIIEHKNANEKNLKHVIDLMCKPVEGLKGLPLTADGFISLRYKK